MAENESGPGRCCLPEPAHPPGATRKVERSTTGRSTGVSLRHDPHRPSFSRGSAAGDAAFGQSAGCPTLLPSIRHPRSPGSNAPPRPGRLVAQPPLPESRPGARLPGPLPLSAHRSPGTVPPRPRRLVAQPPLPESELGPRLPGPLPLDAVHADPVSHVIAGRRRTFATGIVGGPRCRRPELRGPWLPVARSLGASKPCGFSLRPEPLPPREPNS